MNWFTAAVVFIMTWWIVLFAVLPFGVHPMEEADTDTGWRGAPSHPHMGRKIIATTLIALVLWLGMMTIIRSDWFSFRAAALLMPDD